jgi:Zn finger protein HypA/HybF involved in hydrogenase expression
MLVAMAGAVLWLGGYAVLCAVKPFAPCRKCAGTGEVERFRKPLTCPRCHGRKLRLRVGRRAHNAWRRTHQAGTR